MATPSVSELGRLRTIAGVMVRHGFGDWVERTRLGAIVGRRKKPPLPPDEQRVSTARRFRDVLVELGPSFVKLGQILSSRPDVLPAAMIAELAGLQDAVPPFPMSEVRTVIETALKKPLEEVFASIEETPLASASIAQVHRAVLKNGDAVVVKVQRPGIEPTIRSDVTLLRLLARLLESSIEEMGIYQPTGIVDEFERHLLSELDFASEAGNLRAFAKVNAARDWIVIPRVYEEFSRRTVLVMSEIRGIKISDVPDGDPRYDKKVLATRLIEAAFCQLFEDGLFHGDPHPGNLLVLEGNRLALLDLGSVGRLSKSMQETIVVLVLSISLRDADTVARLLYKVGIPDDRINLARFSSDIHEILDRYLGLKLNDIDSPTLLRDLLDLAMRYRIKVPKEYALLGKASITIEGIIRKLSPELDVAAVALPYAKRLLAERYNPQSFSGGALRLLLAANTLLQDVPTQLSQILMDLEGGKFSVRMVAPELLTLNRTLKGLAVIVFMGLIASGLIVGSFNLLAQLPWAWRGVPVLAILGLVGAGSLFGAAVSWYLVSGRIRKIRLRRWSKR